MNDRLTAEEIFHAAREKSDPAERAGFLDGACGHDVSVRAEVEGLLKADADAGMFLQEGTKARRHGGTKGGGPDATIPRSSRGVSFRTPVAPSEHPGETIDRYKLLQQIGEGGFGVVYMAEQREPFKRRVALKIIKQGCDTRQVIARFEAERQALALMDHPHIAKVLDAGATATGRPFFVMEYIRGVPILEYCDAEKLHTQQRLELFTKVCHAIQHAHQKGIIHRDIKPNNVLVTMHDGVPVPKVIDFGIAKATNAELTTRTLFTEHRQMIGTPAYMSPEQAEMSGLDIDTRSDIYSLGVLLYEMLTGTTPFDTRELTSKGYAEMMRIIREVEPHKPSTRLSSLGKTAARKAQQRRAIDTKKLSQTVKGDLDWIVMRCLEKDRTRRYETANGLAMDVHRYLDGEPVLAAPPSTAYRLKKFVRRNRGMVTAGSAVVAALLIGVIAFAWQAKVARDQRDLAVEARKTAQDAQAEAAAQQQKAEAERHRAEVQLTRAEWLVYAGKLMLAQTDFEAANGGLALHYLGECQQNLRGWEWRYLSTRINAERTLVGHRAAVSSAAVSPDGQRIVTGSEDKTARVWDAASGREMFTLEGHKGLVLSVAFSPDGQRILTGGGPWGVGKKPGEVKVWDAATGQLLRDLQGHAYCVWSVAFSPDGQRIVSSACDWAYGPGEVKVWNAAAGRDVLTLAGHAGGVRSVAFSPDGQRIVSGSEDLTAKVWDAATGEELLTLKGHAGGVRSTAFSPDGQRLVTAGGDRTAKVWDAATGQEPFVLEGHASWLNSVAFSPDGKRIVTGSADQTTRVWDAATGQERLTLKGHAGQVRGVAFSPDGQHIVTGSNDRTAKVWDAEKGQEVPTLKGHADFISSIAFSPDGKRIVTGSGDCTAKLWDTVTAREVLTLEGSTSRAWAVAGIWSVAFSPDGRRILTGSQDQTAKVWDAATGQVLLVLEHTNVVSSVAFSSDGQHIVTGCGEWGTPDNDIGEAKVWDALTGRELLTLKHTNVVSSVAFSPDGKRIVTAGRDETAKVWDATMGLQLSTLNGHTGALLSVAFSPDGQRIITGSRDSTAKVWDAVTGQELLTLKGHTDTVRSVTFSPDGNRIVTGGDDRSAKVWDAETGQELLGLQGHAEAVWSVAFSPDGQRLVTGIAGANAIAKVWYGAPSPPTVRGQAEETADERLATGGVEQNERALK
ncbi:MAG: hypothetical protein C4547_12955 [Phycisphaerales bacterium]|nr:MAG: hypothetical protein C4547_12955 [Phycisphaerales bacterium]